MSIVLGINLSHDTSVCLIKNGRIYSAEEERWTGLKHNSRYTEDYLFPHHALHYVLQESGTAAEDIQQTICVSMSERDILGDLIFPRQELAKFPHINYISHHKAHILSGFLLSPFSEAVALCVDGGGSVIGLDFQTRERTSGFYCNDGQCVRIFSNWDRMEIRGRAVHAVRNSLGLFYLNFAQRCVPLGDEPEGSMMAMAACATSDKYYDSVRQLITLYPNGLYQIQAPYGSNNNSIYHFNSWDWSPFQNGDIPFEERANLAYAVQRVFEETVFHVLTELFRLTHCPNLVFSGGCALNSRLNGRIFQESEFSNIYIPPAPHDGGTALGAALYAWHYLLGEERLPTPVTLDWGPEVGELNAAELHRLRTLGFVCRTYSSVEVVDAAAELLLRGKVLLWAQGRMEFGPRALGNRSIIACPQSAEIRNRINRIKCRAWYRPLAPSVPVQLFPVYFDGDADPYMNKTARVRDPGLLPAVTHTDQTARVQLVYESNSFYPLLMALQRRQRPPVILNTSLNLKGMPIANSRGDVIKALLKLDVDAAVIGCTIISRNDSVAK